MTFVVNDSDQENNNVEKIKEELLELAKFYHMRDLPTGIGHLDALSAFISDNAEDILDVLQPIVERR